MLLCEGWIVRTRLDPARYVGGALLSTAVFLLLYVFFVRTLRGQSIDQLAYDGADFGQRSLTPLTQGVLDVLPAASAVVGLLLTIIVALARRNVRTLVVALGVGGAAIATTQLLKHGVLSRPDLGVEGYAGNSFPSGHTTVAAASALALFLVASPRTRSRVGVWGTAFAVLAGLSTLADQWHRPSDVIAALLVVAFWGCVGGVFLSFSTAGGRAQPAAPNGSASRQWWLAIPFVLVAALAFAITGLGLASGTVGAVIAYIGGLTAIAAAGFLIALTATRLFARLP